MGLVGGGPLKTRPLLNVSSNLGNLFSMTSNSKRVKTAKNSTPGYQKIDLTDVRNGSSNRHTVVTRNNK